MCSVSIPSSVAWFAVFFGSFVNLQLHLHLQKVRTHPKMLNLTVYVSISREQTPAGAAASCPSILLSKYLDLKMFGAV